MMQDFEWTPLRHQRGWIGLVVLLLALVIVAMLSMDALKQYGMLGGSPAVKRPTSGTASAPPEPAAGVANSASTPTPIERARGVEAMLRKQADEAGKGIDDTTR
jgi:hypothetical protein